MDNLNKPLKTIFAPLAMAAGLIFFQAYMSIQSAKCPL
jgi:hypothetical protein